jgi:hypothetical protein
MTVDHENRGAIHDQLRLRLHVDFAAVDIFQIPRQPRYAVAIDAAQIGPDQAVGNVIGVAVACAGNDQYVVDEALQLLVADDNLFTAHASAALAL